MTEFLNTTKRKRTKMEQQDKTPETQQNEEQNVELSAAEIEALIKFDKTIDIENAPKNSVLVVKLSTDDRLYANNLQMGIIERVLKPRMEVLKEKHLTVLFMASNDDVALLSEEDMGRAGWVKKEPSLIIKP